MMKKMLLTFALVLAASFQAQIYAQTKAETKLYQKTISKPSLKAYEKFLKKYPESKYAPQLTFSRDSMIFVGFNSLSDKSLEDFISAYPSSMMRPVADSLISELRKSDISAIEAGDILFKALCSDNEANVSTAAAAFRYHDNDYIAGAVFGQEGKDAAHYNIYILKKEGSEWNTVKKIEKIRETLSSSSTECQAKGIGEWREIAGSNYFEYAYMNLDKGSSKAEFVSNLLDLESETIHSAVFYGKMLKDGRIEGQSTNNLAGGIKTPEQSYFDNCFTSNENLMQIERKDALTDEAIEWWLEKNPKAQTNAKTVAFGILEKECGIVEEYAKQAKEKSDSYNAAMFDIRGYTVVCAYNKKAGNWSLVWAEPAAKDKNRDRLLNTIYFENGSTLCLYYYQGRKTFKIRLNLANKSISR